MSNTAVALEQIWKKFKKGESYDSLRDLIPAITNRLFSRNSWDSLKTREFWALRDVTFEVKHGDALGIIGPNGAGKSTILKLLSGIMRPTKGAIKVSGRLSALIEVGAGFHPDLTGRENIYLNGTILGMKKLEIDKKLDCIIAFSGLEDFIDTPVKRYSSGMYARLGFSVAAHVDPEILLVDEVLSVGDMRFQEKCVQSMLSAVRSGTTIVFISHNLAAVNTLCPKAAFLLKGSLQGIGPTAAVIKEYVDSVQRDVTVPPGDSVVWNVRLVDENKQSVSLFRPGQKAYLRFKLAADLPFGDCLLVFIIRRVSDGLPVCNYSLPLDSIKPAANTTRSVECVLRFEANLLRGAYTIHLHVRHFPSSEQLAVVINAAFFSVEERVSHEGVAHLGPVLVSNESRME